MIQNQTKGLIQILRAVLTGKGENLPEGFSLAEARRLVKEHQIYSLAYYGALNCGISKTEPAMVWLFQKACQSMAVDERQKAFLQMLTDRFEAAKIDYLLLKGSVLKPLYPLPDMRMMSDADILIRVEQYEKIRKVMEELGYEAGQESDHELHWSHPSLHVELHKRVVPSYDEDLYSYYHDGWDFAVKQEGTCRYEMKPEDLLIYLVTHGAKHYRDGGIGIKHFCDFWLLRQKFPDLDMTYVRGELKKLELDRFYENVEDTVAAWFEGKEFTPAAERITQTVFASGAYGTQEQFHVSEAMRRSKNDSVESARRSKVVSTIFPPYRNMCLQYSNLKKAPVLLPYYWTARWVRTLVYRRDRIRKNMSCLRDVDGAQIVSFRRELDEVGLPVIGRNEKER